MEWRTQESSRFLRTALGLALALAPISPAIAQSADFHIGSSTTPPVKAAVAPYVSLDDTPATFTNFNAESIRPIVATPDGADYYALNTHGSFVAHFNDGSGQPAHRFHTPMLPVSIALWNNDLLIVCQGTHCLARMDRFTGDIVDLVRLPSEPGDIAVDDATDQAFVACAGEDVVAQVDLATMVVTTHKIPSKRPRFLALEADGSVLIAPMLSGNNSTAIGGGGNAIVVDLADPQIAPTGGLPDHDLYRLRPATGNVAPVLRGMGSILLAHGRNPATGAYWMLNIHSKNKDPLKQSEPAVNGDFAVNALSIGTIPVSGIGTPTSVIDLDDSDPATSGNQYDPSRTVAFPFGLTFASSGFAFIAGSQSDRVAITNAQGSRILDLVLPGGAIPRFTLLDPTTQSLALVYGWGTNKVYVFSLANPSAPPFLVLDLGLDPTPPAVRAGRAIFYDASFSSLNRFTCGHCHPGGLADGLAWNISNTPVDNKGPMVTQTLFGLEAIFPYHWRGERSLSDFNVAFTGLLGSAEALDETPGGELELFEEFIFSLAPPANPRASLHRLLEDNPNAPPQPNGFVGFPVAGQSAYLHTPSDGILTCNSCHSMPTGTNGDVIAEIGSQVPVRTNVDVTAFSNGTVGLKDQTIEQVDMFGGTFPLPELGFGMLHPGTISSLFGFVDLFNQLSPQETADVTAFIERFDQGVSPAAHAAWRMDGSNAKEVAAKVADVLLKQAQDERLGCGVMGTFLVGGSPVEMRWVYEPATERFLPEDANIAPQELRAFVTQAQTGLVSNIFLGLPPGNQTRFAVDFDADGLWNGDEFAQGTDEFDEDSDGDSWPDGYEVDNRSLPNNAGSVPTDVTAPVFTKLPELLWVNSTVAKFTFETSEPSDYQVLYQTSIGPQEAESNLDPSTVHTVVLQDLFQSSEDFFTFDYTGSVTISDLQGNLQTLPLPAGVTTETFIFSRAGPFVSVIGDESWNLPLVKSVVTGTLGASGNFRVDLKGGGAPLDLPFANQVVVCNLLRNGAIHSNYSSTRPTAFTVGGQPYTALPGPFVISSVSAVTGSSPTDGWVGLDFLAQGLQVGDEISLNIVAVVAVDPNTYDPGAPDFPSFSLLLWSMPDTPKLLRSLDTTF